jgi:tRNA(adenine34) deaminase
MLNHDNTSEFADEDYMRLALAQGEKAFRLGEVPVGAVAVCDGKIIAQAFNCRETLNDPTNHAEMSVIRQASAVLGRWRLTGVTLYVTLEPCVMCAGAMVNARIDRLVFGAFDPKAGGVSSLYDICRDVRLNHQIEVRSGILQEEAAGLLKDFFSQLREMRQK